MPSPARPKSCSKSTAWWLRISSPRRKGCCRGSEVTSPDADGWIERALIQQSPACQWALDANGRFLYISGNCDRFFGKTPDELRGRLIDETLPADELHKWRASIRHTLAEGQFLRRDRI